MSYNRNKDRKRRLRPRRLAYARAALTAYRAVLADADAKAKAYAVTYERQDFCAFLIATMETDKALREYLTAEKVARS